MFPTAFTKQEAVEQAKVLGIAEGTMKRWLTKYTQSGDIQRIEQGRYERRVHKARVRKLRFVRFVRKVVLKK
jgi:hypothetical protein